MKDEEELANKAYYNSVINNRMNSSIHEEEKE